MLETLARDAEFLNQGKEKARKEYEEKRAKQRSSEAIMMALAWGLTGFEELSSQCAVFKDVIRHLKSRLQMPRHEQGNIKADVSSLRNDLLAYTKNLFGKKRTAATHLFVFMIADESRNMKPYAVPVRVLPFKSVKDKKVRELEKELRNMMTSIGMKVVGRMTYPSTNNNYCTCNCLKICFIF